MSRTQEEEEKVSLHAKTEVLKYPNAAKIQKKIFIYLLIRLFKIMAINKPQTLNR